MLVDAEFHFEKIIPLESEKSPSTETYREAYGTKWNRYDYRLAVHGREGIEVLFSTAWDPPTEFLEKICERYPKTWIKCIWREEGGMAGVWIGRSNPEPDGKPLVEEFTWQDLCLEEQVHRFRPISPLRSQQSSTSS